MPSKPYTPIRLNEQGFASIRRYKLLFASKYWSGVVPYLGGARLTFYREDSPLYAWQFTSVDTAIDAQKRWMLKPCRPNESPSKYIDRAAEKGWIYDPKEERWQERDLRAA